MDEGQFARYRERVAYFHNADLSNLSSQEEIAAEQRSRVFERYYGVIVPPELWQHVTHVHEIIDHRPPEHLGQAASWIFENLRSGEPKEQEDRTRRDVQAATPEELLERAYDFYADVAAEQTSAVGGINALLSCSLERYPWRDQPENHVTLLRPEALGLRIVATGERPDDIVDALRQGKLVVESVIGGPSNPIDSPGRGRDPGRQQ